MSELLSITSSKTRDNSIHRLSKKFGRNHTQNSLLQGRKNLRIYEDGYDVTPKILNHEIYRRVESRKLSVFDLINLAKVKDNYTSEMTIFESKFDDDIHQSNVSLNKFIFRENKNEVGPLDEPIESLFATQDDNLSLKENYEDKSRAPSPFCLPR